MFNFFHLILYTSLALSQIISLGAAEKPIRRSRIAKRLVTGKTWAPDQAYNASNFFDKFTFFVGSDPTHGLVNYLNAGEAQSKGLAVIEDGFVRLSVDHTTPLPPGTHRDSVRVTSKDQFNNGLFIISIKHMPGDGCGYWPAYWSVGPDWPNGGEIDVIEGVNENKDNQYTLHTSAGCTMSPKSVKVTSNALGSQCATINGDNSGCAFTDTDDQSYGDGLNAAGGAVFAHLWDSTGITIWRFLGEKTPSDITSGQPDPSSWGEPAAQFSSASCDMAKHFYNHSLVINTTLCGDWAGNAFPSECQAKYPTCGDAVADPANFLEAYWDIGYIKVFV